MLLDAIAPVSTFCSTLFLLAVCVSQVVEAGSGLARAETP